MAGRPPNSTANLVLGWTVTGELEPKYWVQERARAGAHAVSDLITVPPEAAASHIAIVGQSGSGRSYFLARIVEEIALKTRSRILVFDQSTSFRRIAAIKPAHFWTAARYDRATKRGFLPDESSRYAFASRWTKITKKVYSKLADKSGQFAPLQLTLDSLPIETLFDEFSTQSNEFRHCHNFVLCVLDLMLLTKSIDFRERTGVLEIAQRLIEMTATQRGDAIVGLLRREFRSRGARSESLCVRAATHRAFVSDSTARLYFSVLVTTLESGLLSPVQAGRDEETTPRIKVFDVPSIFSDSLQTVAISGFLNEEWQVAKRKWQEAAISESEQRSRAPLYIVVDEAHSVIPAQPSNRAEARLRDQFRDIAADGTKVGVYLVLMSHRPDRLDPLVLSDCDNRAIMRLGSSMAVEMTSELLGLDHAARRVADLAPSFGPGCALMCGPWAANGPTYVFSAARRTEEGALDWKTVRDVEAKRKVRGKKEATIRLSKAALIEAPSTKETNAMNPPSLTKFQCFISYASEDRDFVEELVNSLSARNISVWWDRGQITLGDKLSLKIDEGLSRSRYGLVIVSPSFVRKKWTNAEIRALLNRAVGSGQKVILPVLVGMNHSDFAKTYPLLADIVSTTYSGDVDELVIEIMQAIT